MPKKFKFLTHLNRGFGRTNLNAATPAPREFTPAEFADLVNPSKALQADSEARVERSQGERRSILLPHDIDQSLDQRDLKMLPGWFTTATFGKTNPKYARRSAQNVTGYQLIVLDIDGKGAAADGAAEFWRRFAEVTTDPGHPLHGRCVITYATFSHVSAEEAPGVRIVFPLAEHFEGDRFECKQRHAFEATVLCRMIWGEDTPIPGVDHGASVADIARLFYFPAIPHDRVLEHIAVFDHSNPSWKPISNEFLLREAEAIGIDPDNPETWPRFVSQNGGAQRAVSEKREDPQKRCDVVGKWVRFCGSIENFFDEILVDDNGPIYAPEDGRYRHRASAGTAGVHLLDDPPAREGGHIFAQSHHENRDPAAGEVMHAWDFFRIHVFGPADSSAGGRKPQQPKSHTAMKRWLLTGSIDPDQVNPNFSTEFLQELQERFREFDAEERLGDLDFDGDDHVEFDDEFDDVLGEAPEKQSSEWGDLPRSLDEAIERSARGELEFDFDKRYSGMRGVIKKLELGNDELPAGSDMNIAEVLDNDPRFSLFAAYDSATSEYLPLAKIVCDDGRLILQQQAAEPDLLATPSQLDRAVDCVMKALVYTYGFTPTITRDKVQKAVRVRIEANLVDKRAFVRKKLFEEAERPTLSREDVEDLMCDVLGLDHGSSVDRWKAWVTVAAALHRFLPSESTPTTIVPIIYSPVQGCGKSELVRTLNLRPTDPTLRAMVHESIPFQFSSHYGTITSEHLNTGRDQLLAEAVIGAVAIELAEAHAFHGASAEAIKDFLDRSSVRYRPPYARSSCTYRFTGAYYVTTNVPDILSDVTGNRRFVLVEVSRRFNLGNPMPIQHLAERIWDVYVAVAAEYRENGRGAFLPPSDEVARVVRDELNSLVVRDTPQSRDAERIIAAFRSKEITTEHLGQDDEFDEAHPVRVNWLDRKSARPIFARILGKQERMISSSVSTFLNKLVEAGVLCQQRDATDKGSTFPFYGAYGTREFWAEWADEGSFCEDEGDARGRARDMQFVIGEKEPEGDEFDDIL